MPGLMPAASPAHYHCVVTGWRLTSLRILIAWICLRTGSLLMAQAMHARLAEAIVAPEARGVTSREMYDLGELLWRHDLAGGGQPAAPTPSRLVSSCRSAGLAVSRRASTSDCCASEGRPRSRSNEARVAWKR